MTKSDHPQGGGGQYAQPQQTRNPAQQVPPTQAEQGLYHPPVQQLPPPVAGAGALPNQVPLGYGQPQAGQPIPPMQQPVAGQMPPPVMPATIPEAYDVPQQGQPGMPGAEPMYDPQMAQQYEAPVDDYQYPQGQSMLPEVPAVAVPPAMRSPVDHLQEQPPVMPGISQQAGNPVYSESDVISSAGEQISQRLAQLQNQYDEEVAGESWGEMPSAITPTPPVDQYAAQQIPGEEYAGYAPDPYAASEQLDAGNAFVPNEQYAQPDQMAAQNYQEQVPQGYQQPQQGYQAPMQEQYAPTPPMQAPQGSYEHAGLAPDSPQQQYGSENQLYSGAAPVQQEEPSGGGMKKLMFGGAFVAALAVGGGAAYTYQYTDLFGSKSATGPAPTIKAGSSPIKYLKKKIAGAGDSINKVMHNRLSGKGTASESLTRNGGLDKLANLAQNGVKTAGQKILGARNGMLSGAGGVKPRTSGINVPRRVKTLIVRPDGTILRPAGNEAGLTDTDVSLLGSGGAILPKAGAFKPAGTTSIRRMKTIGEASSARIIGEKALKQVNKPVRRLPKIQAVKKAIVEKPVIAKKPTIVARAAPAPNLGAVGKPFVVQVTSRSSQTSALAAFADMQQKYPNLIGAYQPDIQRANLGSKGVWYRLRVGPVGSKVAASDLCNSLKQAGHPGCFVRRK